LSQQPYPPSYPPHGYAPQPQPQSNGLATGGFVTALCGAVIALIPFLGIVSWVISPIGLILSIVGLVLAGRRQAGRGLAIAGIVLGVLGLIICSIYLAAFGAAVEQVTTPSPTGGAPAIGSSDPSAGPLVLEISGEDVDSASVTHSNETGGVATSTEDLPFRVEVPDPGIVPVTLSATPDILSGDTAGRLTCTITQGGRVVSTQTAEGDFAAVFCSG
jgi:hypothetical protein